MKRRKVSRVHPPRASDLAHPISPNALSARRTQLLVVAAAVTAAAVALYSGGNDPTSWAKNLFKRIPASGIESSSHARTLLSAGGSCGFISDWEKAGGVVGYFFGVFFMFLGIAIVCDDFFVAALEKICEVLRLSDDVAGATFMAAGSSAPELASSAMSLINPNAGSEIGVGTIVGSAIFNILIIVGATVIATGNTLHLDWKPMTRDCFFYAAAIAGIVGTFARGRVDWWEGAIYVGLYCAYIVTMMYNVQLLRWLDSFESSDRVRSFKARLSFKSARDEALEDQRGARSLSGGDEYRAGAGDADASPGLSPPRPEGKDFEPRAAKALWGKLRDEVVEVRKHDFAEIVLATAKVWKAKRTVIDRSPRVGTGASTDPRADDDPRDAHEHWLTPTMTSGHIRAYRADAVKASKMLAARDRAARERAAAVAEALEEGSIPAAAETPVADDAAVADDASVADDTSTPWSLPEKKRDWPLWAMSLPWYAAFQLTIPPCGHPRWEKWYAASFAASVLWIGFITHWMVEWCVRIGCVLKIPAVVMGTTVLAAGTSIPDALSSIAVARDGLADMAVANAVGSNVFDIWLGLGLPWLLYLSWQTPNYILVNTDELIPSSFILAGVLVIYYGSVASAGFKLTVRLGYAYVGCYFLYVCYSVFVVWLADIYGLNEDA